MAKAKLITIIVVIIIIVAILLINFNIFNDKKSKETKPPEAMIEIQKKSSGEVIINQGDSIFFTARNSSDTDGRIDNYLWDFGDGSTSNKIDALHQFDKPGVYNVTLIVEDNDGNKDISWIIIKVNNAPVVIANFVGYPSETFIIIPVYDWVQFNSTGTYDHESELESLTYTWDFGDNKNSTLPNPKHQYDTIGTFDVILGVTDGDGGRASTTLEIQVINRTYSINWVSKHREVIIESNQFTRESEWTNIIRHIEQEQLGSVNVTLNWTDQQPFLKNNQTNGEDLFELTVVTPENKSEIQNSTSGIIKIVLKYKSSIDPKDYEAKTSNDAITQAINDADFSDAGSGDWNFNVSAIECKGGSWINDQFDLDIGNLWSLKVDLHYFDYEITEITYDDL